MPSENENIESEESFEDGFLGASVEVEERGFGQQYPTVQWVNGNPKNKKQGGISYTGGFFCSTEQGLTAEQMKGAGFEPASIVTNDGTEIVGFAASKITGSPIRFRRCWTVQGDGQVFARRFGWDEYDAAQEEGKPRGVAHILFAVNGLEEPVLVSFRGLTAKAAMGQGKERGFIPTYGNTIVARAKKLAKAASKNTNYPLCAFRMTIESERTEDGKSPKFTEVGTKTKNIVTMPVWADEPTVEVDQALLNRLYVGAKNFAMYQDWHQGADEWVSSWDSDALQGLRSRRASKGSDEGAERADGTPGDQQIL